MALLSFRPLSDDVDEVTQVLPGALLIKVERGLSLITFANQRPSLVDCFLRSACLRDREGVQLRLSFPYGIFVSVAFLCEQADVHGVHRRNHARLLQHVAVVSASADRATEVFQRSDVRKEFVQFFPNVVVERADPVRWGSGNLQREIGNPPDALELEPWSGANFLPDLANLFLIRLDSPFVLVERLLQFDLATVREIGPACCQAGSLEIGDRADRITLRRVRDLRQVPPRGLFLALFVLRVLPGWRVPEPIFYEQRESRSLDDANPVEVIEIGR